MAASAYAIAQRLLQCLCAQLQDSVGGPVCQCCVRPGVAPPPADVCCDCGEGQGQAVVQLGELYPSDKFPRKGIQEWNGGCAKGQTIWVQELIMTVYRCVHVMGEDGVAPRCADVQADAEKIASDAEAMLKAFTCCDWPLPAGNKRIMPGSWQPLPNQGGCGGGTMTVYVGLGYVCCD